MGLLKRVLRGLAFGFLAVVLLFEEWGWEPLARAFARLARLPLWGLVERKIAGLHGSIFDAANVGELAALLASIVSDPE